MWATLHAAGDLERSYPDPPSISTYETYLERCQELAGCFDSDPWTLYTALFRLGDDGHPDSA